MVLTALLVGLATVGCRHGNAINFVTNTQFGVKVGVNAEKIPEVQIGYNRQEATRVPVYWEQRDQVTLTSPGAPSINVLLKEAQIALSVPDDATVRSLIAIANSLPTPAGATKSPVLTLVVAQAAKPNYLAEDRKLLASLIRAELDRPAEVKQFFDQGKFIAKHGANEATDAYSVLGTFSGDGGGNASDKVKGHVKVAQFFATGVAAQLLAKTGGAALVNPAVQQNVEQGLSEKERDAVMNQAIKEQDESKAIAKHIFSLEGTAGGANAAVQARKDGLNRLADNELSVKTADFLAGKDSEAKLASALQQVAPAIRSKMFSASLNHQPL